MRGQSIPLTKRFAVFGGLIIVIASLLLIGLFKEIAGEDLDDFATHRDEAIAKIFSTVVWSAHAGFLTTAHILTPEAIRQHPETQAIRDRVVKRMSDLSILKIKIYDLNGLTVFSTNPAQIGENKNDNAGFAAARFGGSANEVTFRDSFSAFEQEFFDRDILESYFPILGDGGAIEGVIEIYYDVTDQLAAVERRQLLLQAAISGTFLFLYLTLIFAVWRSEKRGEKHYQQSLSLAQAAARAEEASRMKSEFLATMSHELRTPLNAILGFSEILKSQTVGGADASTQREYSQAIWSSGRLLLNIVDDVLDMSKVEAGQMTLEAAAFDPIVMAESVLRLMEPQALAQGVDLNVDLASDLPAAFGDERRIKQILINLLSNAVKFTPNGGRVSLWIGAGRNGDLMFAVTDTGIGIEADDIQKVLSPFGQVESTYARKFNGAGLGLTIAKSLIEMHGGRFIIESAPGKGTKVSFSLPSPNPQAAQAPMAVPA